MVDARANIMVRDEFCIETKPEDCAMVIFGASGDLVGRKLIPALYNLNRRKLLPEKMYVVGCGRSQLDDEEFRKRACTAIMGRCEDVADDAMREFVGRFFYVQGVYDDEALYARLVSRIQSLDRDHGMSGNRIVYLATPPQVQREIVGRLGSCRLAVECESGHPCTRVVIEKPFGDSLESSRALDRELHRTLAERQIYRIDHYVGKETVQNILMLRFANTLFEPIWNRNYIDHVQITVAETAGIEHRAGYYDKAGALRDVFQNHMIQMLSLVAMEPAPAFQADRVRDEKTKLIRAIRPFPLDDIPGWILRGQYEASDVEGRHVPGYREEKGVGPQSTTETYVAARFMIDNWRWRGVPFYLRAGKRLPKRLSEIAVVFKRIPHSMFVPIEAEDLSPNMLVLNVQPDEGMALTIQAKHPGPKLCMSALTMDVKYREVFGEDMPDAYERLLLDCMLGDQMLFNRSDAMELAWELFMPVLERWALEGEHGLYRYPAGSWGPPQAEELPSRDGRIWRGGV